MCADPEPYERVAFRPPDGAVVDANADCPVVPDPFEVERGMVWVCELEAEGFVCLVLRGIG
ncbi:MAG: hypothetical protein KJ749_10265 [Planctomycetes bacterium]|nr:hypothetical protein [Planctomycetota bacterium]